MCTCQILYFLPLGLSRRIKTVLHTKYILPVGVNSLTEIFFPYADLDKCYYNLFVPFLVMSVSLFSLYLQRVIHRSYGIYFS
jgi:hypothetical protein